MTPEIWTLGNNTGEVFEQLTFVGDTISATEMESFLVDPDFCKPASMICGIIDP